MFRVGKDGGGGGSSGPNESLSALYATAERQCEMRTAYILLLTSSSSR